MEIRDLPVVNAFLNGSAAVLLALAYVAVRKGRIRAHKALMLGATGVSAAFLVSYLFYHWHTGSTRFQGPGKIRVLYLGILLTHTVLATVNVPLILRALFLASKERFEEHKRLTRWLWPSWMYVSVTGVVVYWMLYRLYPAS